MISALLLMIIFILCWYYGTHQHNFFRKIGVPTTSFPLPFLGTIAHVGKYGFTRDDVLVKKLGRIYGEIYGAKPVLVIADAEFVRQITVSDSENFYNRKSFATQNLVTLSLFFLQNDPWKHTRTILSRPFTIAKIKKMMPLLNQYSIKLSNDFLKFGRKEVELTKFSAGYALNIIFTTLFNMDLQSSNKNFLEIVADYSAKLTHKYNMLIFTVMTLFPILEKPLLALGYGSVLDVPLNFFIRWIDKIIDERLKLSEKNEDFIQELMDQMRSRNDIIANSLLIFFATYANVASCIAWVIYLLTVNPDCQSKLFHELQSLLTRDGNEKDTGFSYELLSRFEYLDQVINETLRLYPTTYKSERYCNKACTVGKYNIPEGTNVNISIRAIHRDEEYWPNPSKFDPERFCKQNMENIVPFSFIPFGSGMKQCLGKKMAIVAVKTAVIHLILRLKFVGCSKTEIDPELSPFPPNCFTKKGLWVSFEKRVKNEY